LSITDAEIIELEELYHQREVDERRSSLLDFRTDKNPNYTLLTESLAGQKYAYNEKEKRNERISGVGGVILEGSSRSGKTWSGIDFIIYLCLHLHKDKGCKIIILRETFAEFADNVYEDFQRRLDYYELDNPFHRAKVLKSFRIGKSTIRFMGCDNAKRAHGTGSDYVFGNEMMSVDKGVFKQLTQRCRIMFWGDYNPSFTKHWVFDSLLKRKDVAFLRTTFKDNPFITPNELNDLLITEPWETGSYEVTPEGKLVYNGKEIDEKNKPPVNKENVDQGTADEFHWKVYGLGLRGAMKGRIYKNITWLTETPPGLSFTKGLDFGFVTDPSALADYARRGRNVYVRPLWYAPTETSEEMHLALKACGVKMITPITADSSDKHVSEKKGTVQMVRELFARGWEIAKVSKTKGIMFWILDLKRYKIHIIVDRTTEHGEKMYQAMKEEAENYTMKEVQGIEINQPNDKFNHLWDAIRYAHMAHGQEL
jgi:phage terminase large subunit